MLALAVTSLSTTPRPTALSIIPKDPKVKEYTEVGLKKIILSRFAINSIAELNTCTVYENTLEDRSLNSDEKIVLFKLITLEMEDSKISSKYIWIMKTNGKFKS